MPASRMRVSLIAALDRASAIGKGNALPWHLPDDLKRFKALTLGKPVLMGRRTADSLGRALPKRRNLVLTRGSAVPFAGMQAVASLDEALTALQNDHEFLTRGGVFSKDWIEAYIALKMDEVNKVRMTTHPVEFDLYYSC